MRRVLAWLAALGCAACTGTIVPTPMGSAAPKDLPAEMPSPQVSPAPQPSRPPSANAGDLVTLSDAADAAERRRSLIAFLWGNEGFPATKLPTAVDLGVTSPVTGLPNLARVDMLHFAMDGLVETFAYHFIPLAGGQSRAVILHQGHSPVLDDDHALADVSAGIQRTIANLLAAGFSVVAMYMPGCLPPATSCSPHEKIVELPTVGSGIKYFLEPVARVLNYLETQAATDGFPGYQDFAMVGLSGGGWTTTVYAALDPRIVLSIPVAGSLPLPMRTAVGDEEQTWPPFYAIADYPDLYLLGSMGAERRQVQVLNRNDDCCFGPKPNEFNDEGTGKSFDTMVRGYEVDVRQALAAMGGGGSFQLEIDEAAPAHMISWNTIASIILTELRARPRGIAVAAGTSAGPTFARSAAGTLVRSPAAAGASEDTGIAIVGIPAWSTTPSGGTELFVRDPSNHLLHVMKEEGAAWTVESLGTVLLTNPVMVHPADDSRFDVAALTTSYLPGHWWRTAGPWSSEIVASAPRTFGEPRLRETAPGQVELVARDFTHASFRLESDGDGSWTPLPAPTAPTAPTAP